MPHYGQPLKFEIDFKRSLKSGVRRVECTYLENPKRRRIAAIYDAIALPRT
ncbi:MAG: hypothetical protein M2R45_00165 [Verrucomicrobia subdivision 3 bacterium]|nr:hypothetical protein [Limisphaerales bacterium]